MFVSFILPDQLIFLNGSEKHFCSLAVYFYLINCLKLFKSV